MESLSKVDIESKVLNLVHSLTTEHFVGHLGFNLEAFILSSLHSLKKKTLFLNLKWLICSYSTRVYMKVIIELVNTALTRDNILSAILDFISRFSFYYHCIA